MMKDQSADIVLQLYAEFRPQQLPQLLLDSWLQQAFTPSEDHTLRSLLYSIPCFLPLQKRLLK